MTETDPTYWQVHRVLGWSYEQKGQYEEAIAEFRKLIDLSGASSDIANLAHAYAISGNKEEARRQIGALEALPRGRYVSPYLIAYIHAGLGESDQAFAWLYKAYEERTAALIWLKANPRFQGLRSDPRFADLVRRIGLPP